MTLKWSKMRVLSVMSGGMNGYSFHMGVLDALVEAGMEVVGVVGASAGALASALFASGIAAQYGAISRQYVVKYLRSVPYSKLGRVVSGERLALTGLLEPRFLIDWLTCVGVSSSFEDLRVPVAVSVLEVQGLRGMLMTTGEMDFRECVSASCAVPRLFEYHRISGAGKVVSDGGTCSRLPLVMGMEWAHARNIEFDMVVVSYIEKGGPVRSFRKQARYWQVQDEEAELQVSLSRSRGAMVEVIRHPPSSSRWLLGEAKAIEQYRDAKCRAALMWPRASRRR